jgi:hypothetical protein
MPQTCQEKYSGSGTDTQPSTACPRSKKFDLDTTRDEQTFKVAKRGNQVTEGGNY